MILDIENKNLRHWFIYFLHYAFYHYLFVLDRAYVVQAELKLTTLCLSLPRPEITDVFPDTWFTLFLKYILIWMLHLSHLNFQRVKMGIVVKLTGFSMPFRHIVKLLKL
jgi:hypothetical protein